MFDIGWNELLVIGAVALLVIGPKDLPQAFRTVGRWVTRARVLAREFQGHVDDLMREAEVEDMKREFGAITRTPGGWEGIEDELMAGTVPEKAPDAAPKPANTTPRAAAAAPPAQPPATPDP